MGSSLELNTPVHRGTGNLAWRPDDMDMRWWGNGGVFGSGEIQMIILRCKNNSVHWPGDPDCKLSPR